MNKDTNDAGTRNETSGVCCNPEDMQKFFQKMAACCSGQGDTLDCRAMMEGMRENFCSRKTEKSKTGCGE